MKVKVNLAMKRSDDDNWEWVYESDEEEPEWGRMVSLQRSCHGTDTCWKDFG